MKRLAFLALLFLSVPAFSGTTPIREFGGLNTDDSPLFLKKGQTADSQNVVTDEPGGGLQVRLGTVELSTHAAKSIWELPHSNGTKYLIAHIGDNLYSDTGPRTFATLISTVASGVTTVGTVLGDTFYFANETDGLKSWNAASTATISNALKFKTLVTHKGRCWGAGVPTAARTIYGSEFGNCGDWTLVATPIDTDPTQIVVGGAIDEPLTALYSSFRDALMWFKPRSFGGLLGDDRSDFEVRTYSDEIGTAYVDSIQDCDGFLRWLGPNRSIWEFNGSQYIKISEPIDSLMSEFAQGDANARSYTITTQAEYELGSSSNTSTSMEPGSVVLSTNNVNISNNSFESVLGAEWSLTGANCVRLASYTISSVTITPQSGSFMIRMASSSYASDQKVAIAVLDSNGVGLATTTYSASAGSWTQSTLSLASYLKENIQIQLSWLPNGVLGPVNSSARSETFRCSGQDLTFYWYFRSAGTGGENTMFFDLLEGGRTTINVGTYTTTAIPLGTSITSFASFGVEDDPGSGSLTYGFYTDTNTAHDVFTTSSYVSSQTITNGSIPTLSTAAYAFVSVLISTDAQNDSITVQWNEGTTTRVASAYPNQRYWLALARNSTTNNRVLVFDKKREWQLYSGINATAMSIFNSALYFSNSNGLFQGESGYDDDDSNIEAYYTTPILAPSGLNLFSTFQDVWITADRAAATLETTFQVDGINTDYSLGDIVLNTNSGIQNRRIPFPVTQVQQGKYIRLKWSVTDNVFWRLLAADLNFLSDVEPMER